MLNMSNQNISLDGQAVVKDTVVATMNMNSNIADGIEGIYFNMNINDKAAMVANKADILADFTAFFNKAVEFINSVEEE